MNNSKVLIISDNLGSFYAEPLVLSPEKVRVTGLDSIRYLGFSGLQAVVIDCASISKILKKISLGIRDNDETQSLWELLSGSCGPKVYLLVDKMSQASPEMQQLGIEYIIPNELQKLVETVAAQSPRQSITDEAPAKNAILTADDVRSLHQSGAKNIPEGCTLTPWAAEVAASLNITVSEHRLFLLLPIIAESRAQLGMQREELFALASRYPSLLFIVNEIYLPIFNRMFPSLSGRTVAPTVHWADQGAFTGEISVKMLSDQRCFGAIVPPQKPYTNPENLKKLAAQAQNSGLTLFSTFTLASAGTCDIIASDRQAAAGMISLYQSGVVDPARLPESGAVVVTKEFLQRITIRKGN